MSEPIWCQIRFKLPHTWSAPDINHPPAIVQDAHVALINGGIDDMTVDGASAVIWDVTGEGNYGLYDDDVQCVLDWCYSHSVPFKATSDPKYDMDGQVIVYDGGDNVWERTGDSTGEVVLPAAEWRRCVESFTDPLELLATIEDYFTALPTLEEISIRHLPVGYPDD